MIDQHSKTSSKDLRITQGIALINNVLDQLQNQKKDLEKLGMAYVKNPEGMSRDVQQLRSILLTSGDPVANDFLTKKINKLEYEISERFPYIRLIEKCMREVWDAFRIAVAKHHQKYEKIVQNAMVKSMQGISVVDEPKFPFLPNKKNRKKKVAED